VLRYLRFNNMILYKFRPIESKEWIADILKNERLHCAPWYQLNDPFEGRFILATTFPDLKSRFITPSTVENVYPSEDGLYRVCSLTSRLSNVLLWSHYASSCSGVAIAIDFTDRMDCVTKMEYDDKQLLFTNNDSHLPGIRKLLGRKTKDWEYEEEYRIITGDEYLEVAGRITGVILGPRFRREHYGFIKDCLPRGATLTKTVLNDERNTIDEEKVFPLN
jgi:hypothetical protein